MIEFVLYMMFKRMEEWWMAWVWVHDIPVWQRARQPTGWLAMEKELYVLI